MSCNELTDALLTTWSKVYINFCTLYAHAADLIAVFGVLQGRWEDGGGARMEGPAQPAQDTLQRRWDQREDRN